MIHRKNELTFFNLMAFHLWQTMKRFIMIYSIQYQRLLKNIILKLVNLKKYKTQIKIKTNDLDDTSENLILSGFSGC